MTVYPLASSLAPYGLCVLGLTPAQQGGILHLIGPDEPAFWPIFSASPEYRDSAAHPLDRWSKRVLSSVADTHQGEAFFPFGGQPYQPFQTWATRSGRFWPSPIGFLVHDTAGLFASFRGAILLENAAPQPAATQKPCDSCAAPCKTACPVDAFANGYDVAACKAHLATAQGADCMALGCRARRACPVGVGNRLPAQASFHMKAFR